MTENHQVPKVDTHLDTDRSQSPLSWIKPAFTEQEAAGFSADLLLELADLARSNGQKTLFERLETAFYEASLLANRKLERLTSTRAQSLDELIFEALMMSMTQGESAAADCLLQALKVTVSKDGSEPEAGLPVIGRMKGMNDFHARAFKAS